MLNTAPRTWVAGEIVTAELLNQEIRDALTALQAPWEEYVPEWTGATTNPTLGDGDLDGRFTRFGKTVHFLIRLTAGATTTYGSGQWRFTLPVTPTAHLWPFLGVALDSSVGGNSGRFFVQALWLPTSSVMACHAPATSAGTNDRAITSTSPFTWATGDTLTFSGTYEAA